MNTAATTGSFTSPLYQLWDRVKNSPLVDPLGGKPTPYTASLLTGSSLHLLVEKVSTKAALIWSLIPFSLFAFVKFPWAAVKLGISVKDCVKAFDKEERVEKGFGVVESLGNLCHAATSTVVLICHFVKTSAPWLFPLGVVGGVFQFAGVISSAYGLYKSHRFVKEMNKALATSDDEALKWISKKHPELLKKHFRLKEGNDLVEFTKDLLNESLATPKKRLIALLKGRLKETIVNERITFVAKVVGVVALPLLLICPPAAVVLTAVSTGLYIAVSVREYNQNN